MFLLGQLKDEENLGDLKLFFLKRFCQFGWWSKKEMRKKLIRRRMKFGQSCWGHPHWKSTRGSLLFDGQTVSSSYSTEIWCIHRGLPACEAHSSKITTPYGRTRFAFDVLETRTRKTEREPITITFICQKGQWKNRYNTRTLFDTNFI